MPFDQFGSVADASSTFNDAELSGLDEVSSATEAGISDATAADFSQGPDGNIGSTIPGAGGSPGDNGFNQVDYNQPNTGLETQPALADNANGIDVNANGTDFNPRDGALAVPIPTVGASTVDKLLTGVSYETNSFLNTLPASLTTAVKDFTAALPGQLTNIVSNLVKSKVAAALPGPLSNLVNVAVDNRVSATAPALLNRVTGGDGLPIATGTPGVFVNAPEVSAAVDQTAAEAARLGLTNTTATNTSLVVDDNQTAAEAERLARLNDVAPLPAPLPIDDNQTAAEVARLTALNGGVPQISTPGTLNTLLADLTKAKATFAAAGIPFPSALSANPVLAALDGVTNNAAGAAGSVLATALSPAGVNGGTATASAVDSVVNAALNSGVAGLSLDQVNAASSVVAAAQAYAGKLLAQRGQVLATQTKEANNSDWRVRLSLAPGADYLYNATPNGILAPLKNTGGVIFPYTPRITTSYNANYTPTDLTHSNYKNYFYQSSSVGEISIEAKFTAQDTNEAAYLLAVIHFFRSVTKMFYGQDSQRGAPPPLVFLTGYGEYQFNQHPCVVSNFSYTMPDGVDYIRARSVNINGASLLSRRDRQTTPTDPISGAIQRIANLFSSQGISPGAIVNRPAPPTLGQNNPTYVPTSVDLSLRLLPLQSRSQVSQQFSLKGFANGDLIKGGFW
jgi:hypothetical protein